MLPGQTRKVFLAGKRPFRVFFLSSLDPSLVFFRVRISPFLSAVGHLGVGQSRSCVCAAAVPPSPLRQCQHMLKALLYLSQNNFQTLDSDIRENLNLCQFLLMLLFVVDVYLIVFFLKESAVYSVTL